MRVSRRADPHESGRIPAGEGPGALGASTRPFLVVCHRMWGPHLKEDNEHGPGVRSTRRTSIQKSFEFGGIDLPRYRRQAGALNDVRARFDFPDDFELLAEPAVRSHAPADSRLRGWLRQASRNRRSVTRCSSIRLRRVDSGTDRSLSVSVDGPGQRRIWLAGGPRMQNRRSTISAVQGVGRAYSYKWRRCCTNQPRRESH